VFDCSLKSEEFYVVPITVNAQNPGHNNYKWEKLGELKDKKKKCYFLLHYGQHYVGVSIDPKSKVALCSEAYGIATQELLIDVLIRV
jgi:hypothetical protein